EDGIRDRNVTEFRRVLFRSRSVGSGLRDWVFINVISPSQPPTRPPRRSDCPALGVRILRQERRLSAVALGTRTVLASKGMSVGFTARVMRSERVAAAATETAPAAR